MLKGCHQKHLFEKTGIIPHLAIKTVLALSVFLTSISYSSAEDREETETYSNIGLGQFTVRVLSLHNLIRSGQIAGSIHNLQPNELWATFSYGLDNIWNYTKNEYLADGEWSHFDLRLAYTLTDRCEIGIYIPFSSRSGGFMDSFIEDFHDTFGFENNGRENAPQNEVHIERYVDGKKVYELSGSSTGINDIPFFLSWYVAKGDKIMPAVVLQPRITIPTGDEDQLEGSDKPVFGLSVILAKQLGNSGHFIYASGDVSYSEEEQRDDLELRNVMVGGTLTWEYRWTRRTSSLIQYNVVSGVANDYDELSSEAHHVNVGIKQQLSARTFLEFSIQENLFHYNNSADAGLHLALTAIF